MGRPQPKFVTITPTDAAFPPLLRAIHDPPKQLHVLGDLGEVTGWVAIVGTRKASAYGLAVARQISMELARRGVGIVSGMALGIDTAAHRGALDAGGRTVAVLGCGVDVVYPWQNKDLAKEIAAKGAIVSELPPRSPPRQMHFVGRNRIIAGMCPVTVVIESPAKGGSLITAEFACDEGRTVCAVPGRIDQPTSEGCHQLIRDGATLVASVADVVSELGFAWTRSPRGRPHRRPAPPNLTPEEQAIYTLLSEGAALTQDAIETQSTLPTTQVAAALVTLELKGCLVRRLDSHYEMAIDQGNLMYLHVDMPSKVDRAKLFRHGGSQAARLPREYRLPGKEAAISRTQSGGVILEPLGSSLEARRRRFIALAGSCPDLPDVSPHTAADLPRD